MMAKVMKFLLLVVSFIIGSADITFGQLGTPIDLFLAIDQSNSITQRNFGLLVDFAESLTFGIANITGLYTSQVANGLRVGVVTFNCAGGSRVRISPSGNETYIKQKYDALRTSVVTNGRTCLEAAVQIVSEWINEGLLIQPPTRATAFLVLTDGKFNDFNLFQDELDYIKNYTGNLSFSVGIGDKTRDSELISVAGTEDRYYKVSDPSSLSSLISVITSFVVNALYANIVYTKNNTRVDFSDSLSLPCAGESLSVQLYGQSLASFPVTSDIECNFTFQDAYNIKAVSIITSAAHGTSDGSSVWYCLYPDYGNSHSTPSLTIYHNAPANEGGRIRLSTMSLSVLRRSCTNSAYTTGTQTCLSLDDGFSWTVDGDSINLYDNLMESDEVQTSLQCGYETSLGVPFTVFMPAKINGDILHCPKPTAREYLDAIARNSNTSAVLSLPALVDSPELITTLGSYTGGRLYSFTKATRNDATLVSPIGSAFAYSSSPRPYSAQCAQIMFSNPYSMCWNGDSDLPYKGSLISYIGPLMPFSGNGTLNLVCGFLDLDNEDTVYYSPAAYIASHGVVCTIPEEISDPAPGASLSGLQNFKVIPLIELSDRLKGGSSMVYLGMVEQYTAVSLNVSFCGSITGVGDTTDFCLGESIYLNVSMQPGSAQTRLVQNSYEFTCQFVDSKNSEIVATPLTVSNNAVSCALQTTSLTQSYNQVNLMIGATNSILKSVELETGGEVSRCLNYSQFINNIEVPSMRSCWGAKDARIKIAGDSAKALLDAYLFSGDKTKSMSCRFTYLSVANVMNITEYATPVPVNVSDSSSGFYCALPADLFLRDTGSQPLVLAVILVDGGAEVIADEVDFEIQVLSVSPCLFYTLTNQLGVSDDTKFCYGDEFSVLLTGESVTNLISAYTAETINSLECLFSNIDLPADDIIAPDVLSSSTLRCSLPYIAGYLEVTAPSVNIAYKFTEGSSKEQFTGELSKFSLKTCYTTSNYVVASDTSARTLNGRFCAGDGYETEFTGQTINSMIALVSSETSLLVLCEYFSAQSNEVLFTANARLGSNTIICEALHWNPYSSDAQDYYDLVEVRLLVTQNGESVSDEFDVALNGENSLCFDDPNHQVPAGYEPPSASTTRRLLASGDTVDQSTCWPSCCQRSAVEISFSGRTIGVLSSLDPANSPLIVRCSYQRVQNPNEYIHTLVISYTNKTLLCGAAPGYEKNGNDGDYSSVAVELYNEDTNQVIMTLKNFSYSPTTGSVRCINVYTDDQFCLGQPLAFMAKGLTLKALYDQNRTLFNLSDETVGGMMFDNNEGNNILKASLQNDVVNSLWNRFDETKNFIELGYQLQVEQEDFFETKFAKIQVNNDGSCLLAQRSLVKCTATFNQFQADLLANGTAIPNYPVENGTYSCKFFSSSGDDYATDAVVDMGAQTIQCTVTESARFQLFQVIYTWNDSQQVVILKEGTLANQAVNCADPSPAENPSVNTAVTPVAWVLPILLILILVAFLVLLFLRQRRKNDTPAGADIIPPSEIVYNPNDKVEVLVERSDLTEQNMADLKKYGLEYVSIPDAYQTALKHIKVGAYEVEKKRQADVIEANPEAIMPPLPSTEVSVQGIYCKAVVKRMVMKQRRSSSDQKEADLEKGGSPLRSFYYKVELLHNELLNIHCKKVDEVPGFMLRTIQTDFLPGQSVRLLKEDNVATEIAKIDGVLPNDYYLISSKTVPGSRLSLVVKMLFKVGDVVLASPRFSEGNHRSFRAEILEVHDEDSTYRVNILGKGYLGEKEAILPSAAVRALTYSVGDFVEVQQEDFTWRRAKVVKVKSESGGSYIYDLEVGVGSDIIPNVVPGRLRLPSFSEDDKVEVLKKDSWRQGVIKRVHSDDQNFDVYLTQDDQVEKTSKTLVKPFEIDEVVARVRNGLPERAENLDTTIPDSGAEILPKALRFKRRRPVDYTELPKHQFELTVPSKNGLGVQFGWTKDKKIIVAGFRDMKNGDWGELEATGLVLLKDQLVAINGKTVANFGISDISALLEESKKEENVTLRFGRSTEYLGNA